eukprot:503320-Heterocapsa_arctica.AAC.1
MPMARTSWISTSVPSTVRMLMPAARSPPSGQFGRKSRPIFAKAVAMPLMSWAASRAQTVSMQRASR